MVNSFCCTLVTRSNRPKCYVERILSLLLPGGRKTHSRFGIPLVPTEFSSCSIKGDFDLPELIRLSKLIIWDEGPMMSKHFFESWNEAWIIF